MDQPNFKERRKYTRIKKHFILTYFDVANPEKKFPTTQLKNISRGGVCLITDKAFEPGTMLGIEIKSPFFSNITTIKGVVLESHVCATDIFYETRMEFQGLAPDAEETLRKSVEFFENKENGYE